MYFFVREVRDRAFGGDLPLLLRGVVSMSGCDLFGGGVDGSSPGNIICLDNTKMHSTHHMNKRKQDEQVPVILQLVDNCILGCVDAAAAAVGLISRPELVRISTTTEMGDYYMTSAIT